MIVNTMQKKIHKHPTHPVLKVLELWRNSSWFFKLVLLTITFITTTTIFASNAVDFLISNGAKSLTSKLASLDKAIETNASSFTLLRSETNALEERVTVIESNLDKKYNALGENQSKMIEELYSIKGELKRIK